jgi:Lipid A 3-O-deacylase (PagL)
LTTYRFLRPFFTPRRIDRYFDCSFGLNYLTILAALCLLAPQVALSQETENAVVTNIPLKTNTTVETNSPAATAIVMTKATPARRPVESEIAVTTMVPDGDYRMFSATNRCNAWTLGVEYDRHSWGHLLKSQVDYVVEVIPIVILSQPAVSDFWGNAKSPNQKLVPGVSVTPFGFRFLWRNNLAVRPYLTGKLGAVVFAKKAFSQNASYTNFNVQVDFGLLFRMSERVDLRVDPFVFFHVSNGYLAASNPGMDELATKIGVSYHLGKRER